MSQEASQITDLAQRHGITLSSKIVVNEMGLDFQVAFATDDAGQAWVLRIPRRAQSMVRAQYERRILEFLKPRIPVAVPDWRVFSDELIAYPLLPGQPALAFNAAYEVTWHMDPKSSVFPTHLAEVIASMHAIRLDEAQDAGVECISPDEFRGNFLKKLERVRAEIGIAPALDHRIQAWIDDDRIWPEFGAFTHGDLYAGHVLVDEAARPTAVIDWTEARFNDPSIDFVGHLSVFDSEGLRALLNEYYDLGGRTWPGMQAHITERAAAAPVLYGMFALESGEPIHISGARAQLGLAD